MTVSLRMDPSPDQKAAILSHIRYEIGMAFVVPRHNSNDSHIREAVFLSMLIHARVLLAFFESDERRQDDVLCSDFGFPTRDIDLEPENRARFNKDMMHLTYLRLRHTPDTKPWPLQDLILPLMIRSFEFIDHIIDNPPTGADPIEIDHWIGLRSLFNKE